MIHNSIIPNHLFLLLSVICFCISCTQDPENTAVEPEVTQDSVDPVLQDYETPDRKIGFIDEQGDVIIQPKFDEARMFQNGLASVNIQGLWGYINKKGEEVISPQYLGSWTFSNGLGRVQSAENRKFGYLSSEGDTIIELKYENARDFKGEYAAIGGKVYWGVINKKGEEVIPPQYDNVAVLSGGYIAIREHEYWGVHQLGKGVIIRPQFQKIFSLRSDILRVKNEEGRYEYINLKGENIFKKDFHRASDPQQGIYAVCDSPGHCYLMDRMEEIISSPFQNIRPANDGVFIVERNNQWGVVKRDGSTIIPNRYDLIYNFQEGYAPYLKNGLWGFMSSKGEIKTPPAFGLAWPFQNGKARVLTRNGIAIINSEFKIIIPASKGELRDFNEGLAPFKTN